MFSGAPEAENQHRVVASLFRSGDISTSDGHDVVFGKYAEQVPAFPQMLNAQTQPLEAGDP